jgi:hypothetical protein
VEVLVGIDHITGAGRWPVQVAVSIPGRYGHQHLEYHSVVFDYYVEGCSHEIKLGRR